MTRAASSRVERAGHVGGGNLTHAVAHDRIGTHTPRLPHGGQRDLDGEEHGLHDVDLVEANAGRIVEYVEQRPVHVRGQSLVATIDSLAERRLVAQQVAGHAGPLRALPREDEHGQISAAPIDPDRQPSVLLTAGERLEGGHEAGAVAADGGQPVVVVAAPHRGSRADVEGRDLGAVRSRSR